MKDEITSIKENFFNYSQKKHPDSEEEITNLELFTELIVKNRFSIDITQTTIGELEQPDDKNPYSHYGLTIEEAISLSNFTGILYGLALTSSLQEEEIEQWYDENVWKPVMECYAIIMSKKNIQLTLNLE